MSVYMDKSTVCKAASAGHTVRTKCWCFMELYVGFLSFFLFILFLLFKFFSFSLRRIVVLSRSITYEGSVDMKASWAYLFESTCLACSQICLFHFSFQ